MKKGNFLGLLVICVHTIIAPLAVAEEAVAEEPPQPKPEANPQPKPKPKPQPKPQPKPGAKPPAQPPGQAEMLKKYDLDQNRIINLSEAQTIQKAYQDNAEDPLLKKYDTNKDAKLSDAEIMKIVPPPPAPAKRKPAPKKPKKK